MILDPTILASSVADANLTMDDEPTEDAITRRAVALLDAAPRHWSVVLDKEYVQCPALCGGGLNWPSEASFGTHALRCTPLRTLAARTAPHA